MKQIKDLTETELEVQKILQSRYKLGREKYGRGISYKNLDTTTEWIDEAIEEAADLLQYLVAMKLRIQNKK